MTLLPDGAEALFAALDQLDRRRGRPAVVAAAGDCARVAFSSLRGQALRAASDALVSAERWAAGRGKERDVWDAIDTLSKLQESANNAPPAKK